MYYYIIDPQKISQKQFERVQNQLYSYASQMGVSGEFARVTAVRPISQLVENAVAGEAGTIVAVGHDNTLQEVINAAGGTDAAIGYIPILPSETAKILGITDTASACRSLAQRRIENLDLGQINQTWFFTKIGIGLDLNQNLPKSGLDFSGCRALAERRPFSLRLEVDGEYKAEFEPMFGGIFNARPAGGLSQIADPTDGLLDVLMVPKLTAWQIWRYRAALASGCLENVPGCAVIHGRRIVIAADEGLPFCSDGKTAAKGRAEIAAVPKKIKMVVGKGRSFR